MSWESSFFKSMGRWSGMGLLLGGCWLMGAPVGLAQEGRVETSQEENQQVVELINQLKDPDSNVRRRVSRELGEIGSEVAVLPLISALQDSDSGVRRNAAEALGKIGSVLAVNPLIATLQDSDSVRRAAAWALENIGEAAVNSLITALYSRDDGVHSSISGILANIGEAAVNPLIKTLQNPESNLFRHNALSTAADLLGEIGSEAAINPLIAALQDPDPEVRGGAARALGIMGAEAAINPLITALENPSYSVWRYNAHSDASEALVKIGEAAVNPLITALQNPESGVRSSVARVLGEIGSEAAVNPLITALQDPDSGVRRSVAAALGEIGSEAAVNPLIAALQDSDSGVRTNTARSLGKIGSEAAVNSLITALQNPDDTSAVQISLGVRSFASGQATCASGQIGLETGHIRNIIRGNAAWALGEIGSGTAVNPLISALQDPEVWVRANTAAALGKIGSDIAVTPLISALQDPEVAVRANVTCALGEIGSDIAVTPLISALQDPEVWVRANAVAALGEIGSEEVVNSLITALQNPDNEVRRSAARALGETDSDAAVKTLIAALQEQNYVGVWLDAADVLIDTLEESENPIVRGLLMRNLQWNRASFVTDALINRLNIQAEVLSNRYRAIASLSHQHHLQNLADSSDLLQTLSDLALREGEDRFIRYGALLLLSSINTPEALSLLDAHQPDFLALIEANFEAKLPFYLPNPLPSDEIESPEPFVEPTMIAAVDPYTSPSNSLPVDTLPQLIIPSIDQGDDPGDNLDDVSADPPETLDEAIAQLERPPAVCRFPWVAKNWSRCRN